MTQNLWAATQIRPIDISCDTSSQNKDNVICKIKAWFYINNMIF